MIIANFNKHNYSERMTVETLKDNGLIGTSEAEGLCGVPGQTLRRWANAGKLSHLRTATGRYFFYREEVEKINFLLTPKMFEAFHEKQSSLVI